jgi:DNA-binding HxlR family transcriptional regulator
LKSRGNTKGTDFFAHDAACPFTREVLTRVGDKWSILLIVLLGDGAKRFNELKRMVRGISQRMLTHTLRGLERDGLVLRTVFPTVPPRVEYALTSLGKTLLKTVTELANWAGDNRGAIERARAEFDRREASQVAGLEQRTA